MTILKPQSIYIAEIIDNETDKTLDILAGFDIQSLIRSVKLLLRETYNVPAGTYYWKRKREPLFTSSRSMYLLSLMDKDRNVIGKHVAIYIHELAVDDWGL